MDGRPPTALWRYGLRYALWRYGPIGRPRYALWSQHLVALWLRYALQRNLGALFEKIARALRARVTPCLIHERADVWPRAKRVGETLRTLSALFP